MRNRVGVFFLASLMIVSVVYVTGEFSGRNVCSFARASAADKEEVKEKEKPSGPPPLVVNRAAPLLLDEPPEVDPLEVPAGPVADNSACFVCHANYEEEPLALEHSKANVGCMKCHGKSLAHRDDEDNITPPDVMFPTEKIEANCAECHDDHDVPAAKVITRWQERCPQKTDPETIFCTDCHGQHRLKNRTVWWNKSTGELIEMKKDEPAKPKDL